MMHVKVQAPSEPARPLVGWFSLAGLFEGGRLLEFLALSFQVLLLGVLIARYNLESPAFVQLSWLVFGGFAVNYFLPLRLRLGFFLGLSLAGLVLVLGWVSSAWVVGVGLVLLGVCHAPVAFRVRLGVLIALAAALVAMRAGWLPTPWPVAIWPILGSMFMFRLMVYFYDLRYQTTPVTLTNSLSYFFMLPNVCFPLFPVVDYQSFVRNYYQGDRHQIHQVGVRWIFRGVVQLILYRMIYKNWSISPYEVANAGDVIHYCLWLFLLYLRLSGQFHVIVGMLHLFGFNLPETHHLYYLARSFTDFWRRINIYWKDFMMKLFFYPAYFRLKNSGPKAALVLSTLVVFVLTWFLHAVQWFWLRGDFLISVSDILFWTILAVLVVVNSLWELSHGRQRLTPQGGISWSSAVKIGVKTLATFTVICMLWSLWSSESLSAWASLVPFLLVPPTVSGWLLIAATIVAIGGGAILVAKFPAPFAANRQTLLQESTIRLAIMIAIASVSINGINRRLHTPGQWIASSRNASLNREDQSELEQGYYEGLLAVDRFNLDLFNVYSKQPPEWSATIVDAGLAEPTNDFQRFVLKPSVQGMFKGAMLHTNRWGMHDKEYALEPPPKCYRIAMLGASHSMGTGVARDKTFEALLESRFNDENDRKTYDSIEILNFSIWAYRPIQQIKVLQENVLPFKPNVVFYIEHPGDNRRLIINLADAINHGIELPFPFLRDLVNRADIEPGLPEPLVRRRIQPFINEIVSWVYQELAGTCRKNGILPIYVSLPTVSPDVEPANLALAKAAGFEIIDLEGVYNGRNWWDLVLSKWDSHPTVEAHRMVADRLFREIKESGLTPLSERTSAARQSEPVPVSSLNPIAK